MAFDPTVLVRLPLLNGGISGGEAYVFTDPADVAALLGLTTKLADIYQLGDTLKVLELRAQFPTYRDDWLGQKEEYLTKISWKQLNSEELDEREQFILALVLVDELWAMEKVPTPKGYGMSLIVAVAEVGGAIEIEGEEPAFFLINGSIGSMMTGMKPYTIRAAAWALSLVPTFPKSVTVFAASLVEEIRTRARDRIAQEDLPILDLTRLDDVKAGTLNNRSLILILIHGLLSTDIGTFDELLRRITRQPSDRPDDIIAIGWPHDTLTSIADNGHQLADLIHERIGVSGPDIAFVCHSRGGLVARETALRLYQTSPKYRMALRGAITLGTPHEGMDLASYSEDKFLSYFVCILAGRVSGRIATLSQILQYRSHQTDGVIHGIHDLRPPSGPGFIASLKDREKADEGKDAGTTRQLNLITVGGDYRDSTSTASILATRFFGADIHHDLVVPMSSSIPPGTSGRYPMPCAHGDYCAPAMRNASGLTAAAQEISRWLPI